jgi:hypothetical protein
MKPNPKSQRSEISNIKKKKSMIVIVITILIVMMMESNDNGNDMLCEIVSFCYLLTNMKMFNLLSRNQILECHLYLISSFSHNILT